MKITQKFAREEENGVLFLWLPKMPPGVDVVVGVEARVVESGKPTFAVAEKNTQIRVVSCIEKGNTLEGQFL